MNGTIHEIDAQRARWMRYREGQDLMRADGDGFACGGLGRHVDGLDVRLLFLSADPDGDAVPLDGEVLGWLKEPRQSPYDGPYPTWGHRERATKQRPGAVRPIPGKRRLDTIPRATPPRRHRDRRRTLCL